MRRFAAVFVVSAILSACSSVIDSAQQTAQTKFQQFLANQFGRRLQAGIDAAIETLAAKGGFLDDPLVRILLPPPLGLVVGVARDLQENPKATLLETLLNQAAEHAIPVAGPILKNIVSNMDTPSLENVMNKGDEAATDYLKEKGGAVVQAALLPAVTRELHANGAIKLYGELLDAKEKADAVAQTAHDVQQKIETAQQQVETVQQQAEAVQNVSQEQLGQYVAERATAGLFKKVAKEELSVRRGF